MKGTELDHNRKISCVVFIALVGVCGACSAQDLSPTAPIITTETASPTSINTKEPPTPAMIEIPAYSFFATLPAGEYMVEEELANTGCLYNYYSIDGKLISKQHLGKCGILSRDGTPLASIEGEYPDWKLSTYDLTNNSVDTFPEANGCLRPSWSPDGTRMAMNCNSRDIFVFSLLDKSLTQPTTWSTSTYEDTWDFATWSPDGKWIVHVNLPDFESSESDGVNITDVSCLTDPMTCKDKTVGAVIPFGDSTLISSSPDSKSIVFDHPQDTDPFHYEIYIYNLSTQAKQKVSEEHRDHGGGTAARGDSVRTPCGQSSRFCGLRFVPAKQRSLVPPTSPHQGATQYPEGA